MIMVIRAALANHLLLVADGCIKSPRGLALADPVIFDQDHPGEDLDLVHHVRLIITG